MYNINKYIRATQYLNNQGKNWRLYNSQDGNLYYINSALYDIIRYINRHKIEAAFDLSTLLCRYFSNNDEVVSLQQFLMSNNIISEDKNKITNQNVLPPFKFKYPLSNLMFVVTNACNLKCIHCYGDYGNMNAYEIYSIDYNKIEKLLPDINTLHTSSVSFTGGEFFLYKDYQRIFELFILNGFEVTIFTNGFLTDKMASFFEKNKDFVYKLKISLDGDKAKHNLIRQKGNSYQNTMKTIYAAEKYEKIDVSIASTALKQNFLTLNKTSKMLNYLFPNIQHTIDVGFDAAGCKKNIFFDIDELDILYSKLPSVLKKRNMVKNKYRCEGGRSLACIDSNMDFKICVIANHKDFIFGNLNNNELVQLWNSPKKTIRKFRKEKSVSTNKCKLCKLNKLCTTKDCRVLAYQYTGSYTNPNPITCFVEEKYEKNSAIF